MRSRRIADILNRGAGLVVALVLVALWQLATVVLTVPSYLLPAPESVASIIVDDWQALWDHSVVTFVETMIAFVLSAVVGLALAVAITYSRWLERLLYPVMVGSQAVPKVAIAPILLVWLGFGMTPKILVAFLIGFFPVVVTAVTGLNSVRPDMLKLVASMGASGWDVFWKVRLPAAMPSIFSGLKVAITLTVVGAIIGEFVGSNSGLGYYILVATGNLDTALVFACVVILTVMGVGLFYLVALAERYVTSWQMVGSATEGGTPSRGMVWTP